MAVHRQTGLAALRPPQRELLDVICLHQGAQGVTVARMHELLPLVDKADMQRRLRNLLFGCYLETRRVPGQKGRGGIL